MQLLYKVDHPVSIHLLFNLTLSVEKRETKLSSVIRTGNQIITLYPSPLYTYFITSEERYDRISAVLRIDVYIQFTINENAYLSRGQHQ